MSPTRDKSDLSRGSKSINGFACHWFLVLYFMAALAAYNAGPVPVPWLAQSGIIVLAVGVIMYQNRVRKVPGISLLLIFFALNLLVTAIHVNDFSGAMPGDSTLPYWAYITVRYVNILTFIAVMYLTYHLIDEGKGETLLHGFVICGVIVSVLALYIFAAHWLHLPELPRNRIGTSGGTQPTLFSGAGGFYHRATGTFQEPSGLATWLVLPFFLSFRSTHKHRKKFIAVMAITLLLTVSLIGVFMVSVGSLVALIITRPLGARSYKIIGTSVAAAGIIFLLLTQVTVGLKTSGNTLADILGGRIVDTFTTGIGNNGRSYMYTFTLANPFPPFGMGIGNGNILAARIMGTDSVVAFLSLYLFTLYSVGYPGMILLGAFLVSPILKYVRNYGRASHTAPYILMAYIGYLVAATFGSEELTPWFAVAAGLVAFEARALARARRKPVSNLATVAAAGHGLVVGGS